ncbi:MAG: TrkA C-terminal domain-containing protein [Acidimicrobiia bacterium]|nr:TrkA C-terminal domain-containing protein [Acidimicrobiia bacterium]
MIALIALLILVTLFLMASRVSAVALEATGMARPSAQFQARSALMGVGYTTAEAEYVTSHPARRRIVLFLMTFGNAGIVTGIGGFILTFIDTEATQTLRRSAILVAGILLILLALRTSVIDRLIGRATRAIVRRFTALDVRDHAALLPLENDYAITEIHARDGDWIVGRPLADLELTKDGVMVLGIHRASGDFVGAPRGETVFEDGDEIVTYGRTQILKELTSRPSSTGDRTHDRVTKEQHRFISEEKQSSASKIERDTP